MDNFCKKYDSWVDWRKAAPEEYSIFEALGRKIFSGGEYTVGHPQEANYQVMKVLPWTPIWTWSFRQIKCGFDPQQVIAALRYIIENSAKFSALSDDHKYGHLVVVMKNRRIAVNEEQWERVKQAGNRKRPAVNSIGSAVDEIIGSIEMKRQLEEMKEKLRNAGIEP